MELWGQALQKGLRFTLTKFKRSNSMVQLNDKEEEQGKIGNGICLRREAL